MQQYRTSFAMNDVNLDEGVIISHIPQPVTPFITNSRLSTKPHLPPEILQHIFTFLSSSSLKSTSLASVAFSQIAHPLLFSTLSVSPLQVFFYSSEPVFRPRWYSEYVRARLQVYIVNDKLRRAVKHVRVSPYRMNGQDEPRRTSAPTVAPEPIIEALIAALPSFPNVDTLSWHCMDILPNWWEAITQVPRLKRLWLNSCTVFPGHMASKVPPGIDTITDLILDDHPFEGQESGQISLHEMAQPDRYPGVNGGLMSLIINPALVQSISTPRLDTSARILQYLSELDVSCSLRSLKLPAAAVHHEQFGSALLRCEELEELCFVSPLCPDQSHYSEHDEEKEEWVGCETLDNLSLPSLRRFTGPASLLVSLLSSTPALRLTDIEFPTSDIFGRIDPSPSDLAHIFVLLAHRRGSLHTLRSVKLVANELSEELVQTLSAFPNLYRLQVCIINNELAGASHSSSAMDGVADLIGRLRIPPRLRQLTIQLPYPTEAIAHAAAGEQSGGTALRTLASRHPLLRSISLHFVCGDRGSASDHDTTLEAKITWHRSLLGDNGIRLQEYYSDVEDSDSDDDNVEESRTVLSSSSSSPTLSPATRLSSLPSHARAVEREACLQDGITSLRATHLGRVNLESSLLSRKPPRLSRIWSDGPRAPPSPFLNLIFPNLYSKWSWFLGSIVASNY